MIGFIFEEREEKTDGGLLGLKCSCSVCDKKINIDTNDFKLTEYNGLFYLEEGALECDGCGYSVDFIIKDIDRIWYNSKFRRTCKFCEEVYTFRYKDKEDDIRWGNKCSKCGEDNVNMRIIDF